MALYDHRMLSLDDRITMGELLLVNGVAMSSPVTGTVADLIRDLGCATVQRIEQRQPKRATVLAARPSMALSRKPGT